MKNKNEIQTNFTMFIDEANRLSSIVKINKDEEEILTTEKFISWNLVFQIKFSLNDPFVEKKIYEEGHACIYPTETFRKRLEEIGKKYFGEEIGWNNTRTTGWFIGEIKIK